MVPSTRRAILIGIIITIMFQMCGAVAICTYAAPIMTDSGSDLHPNEVAIIMLFIAQVATFISIFLVEIVGRKVINNYSICNVIISKYYSYIFFRF